MQYPKRFIYTLATFALVICGGCKQENDNDFLSEVNDRTYAVTRGNFDIQIKLNGDLASIKEHKLRFDVGKGGRDLTFTFVLPDRSKVKKGDVIFKVSDEWFLNEEDRLSTALLDAEQRRDQAFQDMTSLESEITSQIKQMVTTLKNAQEALNKYTVKEAPDRKKALLNTINEKIGAVDAASADLFQAQLDLNAAYTSDDENAVELAKKKIEEKQRAYSSADNHRVTAVDTLRDFRRYEHRNKLEALNEARTLATLRIQKEMTGIKVKFSKKELEITNIVKRIGDFTKDLAEIREILPQLNVTAPVDGMLFLDNDNWRYRDTGGLKAGARVDQGAELATIPDLSKFSVTVQVPEEFRAMLKTGLKAKIRAKAIPDLILDGQIKEIAGASSHLVRWDESTPKVYKTIISTDIADERLTPGMSVNVEIMADEVKDACYVPIEAVYNRNGQTYVRMEMPKGKYEERAVSCAKSSIDFVEIEEGLKPGEIVQLIRE